MTIFRTVEGIDVTIRPVSMVMMQRVRAAVEAEVRAEGIPLSPPTYTVTTAVGVVETHEHDEESVQTPEETAALQAYRQGQLRIEEESRDRGVKILLAQGIRLDAIPASWMEEMRMMGLPLSGSDLDQRLDYLQMGLLKTPADLKGATAAILEISMTGAPKEAREAVAASFRYLLGRDTAGEGTEDAPTGPVEP